MLSKVFSAVVIGIDAHLIEIEVDSKLGMPATTLIGLPDTAVKESKDRIRSAIKNSQFNIPSAKTTINLAPADIKKEGPYFDLPIAIGFLSSIGFIQKQKLNNCLLIGELSLDGLIRPVKGAISIALACRKHGIENLILSVENARQACIIEDINVFGMKTLAQACDFLNDRLMIHPMEPDKKALLQKTDMDIDFSDIKGQAHAKRAIEIAISGGHNILMIGPPGSGKTMIAQRIPSIIPPMHLEQIIQTTRIHSISGVSRPDQGFLIHPPFRSPHHTISTIGLIGGGSNPKPGEISLAHNGVLFLDELPEFSRSTLEVLRQPMEAGRVHIARAKQSLSFPAEFILVCAMNPCPCGYLTDPKKNCQCSSPQIQKYLAKISGPLMDRIDIHIEVPALNLHQLQENTTEEPAKHVRRRVQKLRHIQQKRYSREKFSLNAQLSGKKLKKYCPLDKETLKLLKNCVEQMHLSARAYDKLIKIARTIADMHGAENISPEHIAEAVQYRSLDIVYNNMV